MRKASFLPKWNTNAHFYEWNKYCLKSETKYISIFQFLTHFVLTFILKLSKKLFQLQVKILLILAKSILFAIRHTFVRRFARKPVQLEFQDFLIQSLKRYMLCS